MSPLRLGKPTSAGFVVKPPSLVRAGRRLSLAFHLGLCSLSAASLVAPVAHAEAPVPAKGVITRVSVEGTRRIEEAVVLAAIGMRRGESITPAKVRRDLKAVYNTGFFKDVRLEIADEEDGVRLRVIVKEKPAVREIRLEGNKKIKDEDIREVLDIRAFAVLNESKIADSLTELKVLYQEKGYYLADVKVDYVPVTEDQVDIVFRLTENKKVIVQRVDFSGNDHIAAGKIKRYMQIKEGGPVPWLTSSGTFQKDLLASDQQTVTFVYLEDGYLDVQANPAKVYLSPDKRHIFISYSVDEGEQYRIGDITIEGDFVEDEGLTEDAVRQITMGRRIADIQEDQWRSAEERAQKPFDFEGKGPALEQGEVVVWSRIQQVRGAIEAFYKDQGYAFVTVVPQTLPNPETLTADVVYQIQKGEKMRIGRINVLGNDPTFDKVVRREIQIVEGDIYRGSLIAASKARLERLGFFEEVQTSNPKGDGENVLDLNFKVTEQPTGSFSLGMGYSNLESLVITGNLSRNNFLGLGYTMSLAVNWSRQRKQGNISFFDPYFLDSRWSFKVDLYSLTQQFQLNEYRRGGGISLGRYLDKRDDIQLRLEYTIADVGLTSIDPFRRRLLGGDLYRNGITSSLGLNLSVDKRNNRIFPTQGYLASASTAMSGGFRVSPTKVFSVFGGGFNFVETKLNFRLYQPLIPNTDKMVLRVNSTVGDIRSTDGQPIPLIHRYRAGGMNSVRGYGWYTLGPTIRSPRSDDPIRADEPLIVGGEQSWVNNIEIEHPIVRAAGIHAVIFFDAGNAFVDPWGNNRLSPLKLRTAIGGGVRWRSPIGPLRFELGFPMNRRENERPAVFDFNIGSFF